MPWCPPTPRARRASRPRHARWSERQSRHPHQITGGDHILSGGVGALDAEVARLAETSRRLGPAEDLLDLAAAFLTELMRGGAHLYTQQVPPGQWSWMRDNVASAHSCDELARP